MTDQEKQARIDYLKNKTGQPLTSDFPGLTESEAIELLVLSGATPEGATSLVLAGRIKDFEPE